MSDIRRIQELEIAVTALRSDLQNHVVLCEGRMRVLWKLAALLSGAVALAVSVSITLLIR